VVLLYLCAIRGFYVASQCLRRELLRLEDGESFFRGLTGISDTGMGRGMNYRFHG